MTTPTAESELLTISQVCGRLPGARGNRRVHPSTRVRWILPGCTSRAGERIKLSATRAGGRWLVSPVALTDFFESLGSPAAPTATTRRQRTRTESQRKRATQAATEQL